MNIEDIIDVDALPEFMRDVLKRPPRREWTDADWAANEARINMLNAGMPGGLRGNLLPKMRQPPRPTQQQAPGPDRAAPLFMRSASMPASSGPAAWDADPAANEARINTLNAGMPGGLRGELLPKMPWPPQPAPVQPMARPPFMQRASMPAPQEQEPDRLIVRDPRATGFPLREGASRDDVLSNLARLGAQITPQHPAYVANVVAPHLASMLRGERNPADVAYERTPLPKYSGKVPQMSAPDPRLPGAVLEAGQLGSSFVPFGWAARAPVVAERLLPMAERALPTSRAAVSSGLYNPPPIRQRPFSRDYRPADFPHGVPKDATGRLTHTPEGDLLVAKNVVGRNKFGQPDVPLPLSEYEPATVALTGQPTQYRSAAQLRGHFGSTTIDRHGKPIMIEIRNDLLPGHTEMVRGHEIAHAIDDGVGTIPTAGLERELVPLYNHLNNPKRTPSGLYADPSAGLVTPAERGYAAADAPREYMNEAIRAYLTNPNWLKVMAPQTAARIREFVNRHPEVSKIIQFNTLAGIAAMNELAPASSPIPNRSAPDL